MNRKYAGIPDVASNRKILQALLNSICVMKEVNTAEDGQEAVQVVLANPQKYDIVFMDNLMPIMVAQ
jgi:CheY-like chemotaxis protein